MFSEAGERLECRAYSCIAGIARRWKTHVQSKTAVGFAHRLIRPSDSARESDRCCAVPALALAVGPSALVLAGAAARGGGTARSGNVGLATSEVPGPGRLSMMLACRRGALNSRVLFTFEV